MFQLAKRVPEGNPIKATAGKERAMGVDLIDGWTEVNGDTKQR